ncbi:hypothetical protein RhiirC2_760876, partial [Rhizophagus irregularis]
MDDYSRDDESLIGGHVNNYFDPLTNKHNINTNTTVMTSTNTNNNDYFNHSNSNGLNAAAMNSMTNDILQNKS